VGVKGFYDPAPTPIFSIIMTVLAEDKGLLDNRLRLVVNKFPSNLKPQFAMIY